MTEEQAEAIASALRASHLETHPDRLYVLENVWTEQSHGDWCVGLHFTQGVHRYEQRFAVFEDDMGDRDVTATHIADWICVAVLQEPHYGDGGHYREQPLPVTAEGRYLRSDWG